MFSGGGKNWLPEISSLSKLYQTHSSDGKKKRGKIQANYQYKDYAALLDLGGKVHAAEN